MSYTYKHIFIIFTHICTHVRRLHHNFTTIMTSSLDVTKILIENECIKKLKKYSHNTFLVNNIVFCENNMKKLKLIF